MVESTVRFGWAGHPHLRWAALVAVISIAAGCGTSPDLPVSSRFQAAEQTFAGAESPQDFSRAARQYQEIIDDGFESGAVFYNQGNAWMRAGEIGRAVAAYRRAKRYRPRDPYLDANLRSALAGRGSTSDTSIADYVVFWQDSLSYPEKFLLTTVLLVLTLATGLGRHWQRRRVLFRRLFVTAAVLLTLSAVSTARDWHRFERTKHGVVITKETVARKGNSDNYEPAFTEPLTEGTEFTLVESRDEWLHVRLGDSGDGWIAARDAVVY